MLVIGRKKGERLYIGDDIEIVISAVGRHGVRVGISAPKEMRVIRAEVRDTVERLNRDALDADPAQIEGLFGGETPATGTGG